MNQRIDSKFKEALRKAIDKAGTQKDLADKAGVPKSNIAKYLSGQVQIMHETTYLKLLPFLELKSDEKTADRATSKNPLTKSLNDLFEQLSEEKQMKLFSEANQMLNEQKEKAEDIELSVEEKEKLAGLGITTENCTYGLEISVSTKALCWLYNSIPYNRKIGEKLTMCLLRFLLQSEPPADRCRELCIKVFPVEANGRDAYYQYAFYLNGTPPRFYTTYISEAVNARFEIPTDFSTLFILDNDSVVDMNFTAQEVKDLKAGKTLKVKSW